MPDVTPWGEWKPDVSAYKGQHSPVITNAYPRGDGYGPVPGFTSFSSALSGACRGFFAYFHTDGTIRIFAAKDKRIYLMSNSAFTWTDVSKGSPSDYTAPPSAAQWQFAQFGTRVMAVNANQAAQSYVVGSSSAFADLAGSPPTGAYITVVGEFTIISGIASDPFTLQWSSIGNPTEWIAGTNSGDTQTFNDGGLVRGVAGGEFGIVFQDLCIREMVYQPGNSTVFAFTKLTDDFGLAAPYSVIKAAGAVYFLSQFGFQKWDPANGFTPIGKERVDRTFAADWDSSQPQLMIGANDPTGSRVIWAYKSVQNSSSAYFDRLIVYDWVLDRWAGYVNIFGEYISTAATPGITLDNLDSVSSSIDALTVSLDSFPTVFARHLAICDNTHAIGLLTGSNLEATLETPIQVQDTRVFVRGQRPITDCSTVMGSVLTAQRTQDSLVASGETSVNSYGLCPHIIDGRLITFKNRFPAGATWSYSVGVEPDTVPTGQL